jgi:hypothetical protein
MRIAAATLLGLLAADAAQAAPFCLQIMGAPPQCLYQDVAACRNDARRQNAVCGVNPREIAPPPGGRFCSVSNGPVVQCLFPDRRSCDVAAARGGAICIDAGEDNARPDPDRIPR